MHLTLFSRRRGTAGTPGESGPESGPGAAPNGANETGEGRQTRMNEVSVNGASGELAPVQVDDVRSDRAHWTWRLVVFVRVVAGLAMLKGLWHWAQVCGFGAAPGDTFGAQPLPWQTATVFFAVIDLVAAVGLWLAAPWGALVWLTASGTMIAVQIFFPLVYGFRPLLVAGLCVLIVAYLVVALLAAREQAG